ncbi:MAG TPA: PBP1A family penicillin-binding protein [Syntrophomonadaceae bacterium]|nr:PBP1A family penicillin-binding protein [Syntrophomonadaceae bacterium]
MFAKIKRITVCFLIFLTFFIAGVGLTVTTPDLMLYATGVGDWDYHAQDQTIIYDRNSKELARIGYKRTYSDEFPEFMKKAVVAVEDRRYYDHSGLDLKGMARAIYTDVKEGNASEGGSTITQQLARTLFLTQEKTMSRKIKEVLLATALEEKYGKDMILNMYLNEAYTGRGGSGMASAAYSYFGKDLKQLNKAQITMLVGMLQAPEFYSPDRNFDGLKERQTVVLNVLAEQGIIKPEEVQTIAQQKVIIKPYQPEEVPYPYMMAYLSSQLEQEVGKERLYQGGIKVYTTFDKTMQEAGEKQVVSHARSIKSQGIGAQDIALVSIDPATGGMRALVGGVNWKNNQLNMALLPRQPGSAIKPLYYAAAMDEGIIDDTTKLNNHARSFGGYMPQNDQDGAPGEVTVRLALLNSYNVASVEVLNKLGMKTAITYLKAFGVTTITPQDNNLALGLGGMSQGISPVQMADAYAAFANQGTYHAYYAIERIEESNGKKVLYTHPTSNKRVISAETAQAMDTILKDVVRYGTGTAAAFGIPSGGKTGTTTSSKDLWFVGYTGELSTAVWVGNSDNTPIKGYGTYGGRVAAPLWRDYMASIYYQGGFQEKPSVNHTQDTTPQEEDDSGTGQQTQSPDTNSEQQQQEQQQQQPQQQLQQMQDQNRKNQQPKPDEQQQQQQNPDSVDPGGQTTTEQNNGPVNQT